MTITANQIQAVRPAVTEPEPEREPSPAQAVRQALLPLAVDVAVPLGGYYLLQALGFSVVMSLALSGVLPALRTIYGFVHERKVEPLALFVLGVTVISIPVSFLTGSVRFMLAKESIGTGPLGVWLIISALIAKPVMASAFRAFLARTPKTARAWDHLSTHSAEFRRCLSLATLVWGAGFVAEFVVRLFVVFGLPVSTAIWAGNIPMIATIGVCIVVAGRWLNRAGELIKAQAAEY